MENEIHCPRCNSTQLTTNKKGFSGKKAVAGAVLTGGIGLLAGTLGSNKIIITCLNCGKQFKPGEDYARVQKKRLAEQKAMKSPGFWIFFSIIVVIFIFLFKSCMSSDNTTTPTATTVTTFSTTLGKYFVIEKKDNDESDIRLSLYVSDVSKIDSINDFLISKYNADKSKYMEVSYFDEKGLSNTYFQKEADDNISEKQKNKLFKHFIAEYRLNPSQGYEKLNYEHD